MTEIKTFKLPTMATIKETRDFLDKKAKESGAKNNLTEYRLRQLALSNQIVHVRAGKKILINLDKLVDFLNIGSVSAPEIKSNEKYVTISRIEA